MFFSPAIGYLVTAALGAVIGWLALKIKDYRRQQHTIDSVAMMTARMVIYSDKFDTDEKIEAYLLYKGKGGNHRTKTYMCDLVDMDIDEYIIRHRQAE